MKNDLTSVLCSGRAEACEISTCRPRCALEVVDSLLATPGAATGEEVDRLLDLRSLLRARTDAEAALALFCDLRLRMEQRHYLAFYRLRRWLEVHLVALVRSDSVAAPQEVPVRLRFFCPVAIRRACLCAALDAQLLAGRPRLEFRFRALPTPSSTTGEVTPAAATDQHALVGSA